jgi:nitroreductase
MKIVNNRETEYPIDDIFLKRYSPRALSGEKITKEELMTLFEAARWAPSSYNSQPWRFLYALRDTPDFEKLFSFIVPDNQVWSKNASALVVVISNNNYENGKPYPTHSFDTGSAWENLALQATHMGLIAHAIGGFDYDKARSVLEIPAEYTVEAMIVIGKPGKIEDLPEDLQEGEKPNNRKKLEEIVFEGSFKN